jgi:uncharacterized membrane protein YbhN (UPF0104 family)
LLTVQKLCYFDPLRRTLLLVAKIAVSAGLLILLLSRTDLSALALRFRQMNLAWALAALAAYGAMIAVSAWRWRVLLRVQATEVRPWKLTESLLVATFFNNFLPSNIGGDVVRVADTAQYTGSKTLATTVVLVDRLLGLVALFLIAAAGAAVAAHRGLNLPGLYWLWIPPLLAIAALVPALRTPRAVVRLGAPLERLGGAWIEERLGRLENALGRFGRDPMALVWTTVAALAVQGLLVVFYLCTAWSLAIPLPALTAVFVVPVSLAAQMLPLSINGFGVREAVFAFLFTRFRLSLDAALSLSLGGAALIMLFSLSGGALFLLRHRRA